MGRGALKVYSHKHAGERHYPWFTVHLTPTAAPGAAGAGQTRPPRRIALYDRCTRCWPVTRTLRPGALLTHQVRLDDWAKRPVNGRQPIPPGSYTVEVAYEVPPEPGTWSGTIRTAPIPLRVEALPARP